MGAWNLQEEDYEVEEIKTVLEHSVENQLSADQWDVLFQNKDELVVSDEASIPDEQIGLWRYSPGRYGAGKKIVLTAAASGNTFQVTEFLASAGIVRWDVKQLNGNSHVCFQHQFEGESSFKGEEEESDDGYYSNSSSSSDDGYYWNSQGKNSRYSQDKCSDDGYYCKPRYSQDKKSRYSRDKSSDDDGYYSNSTYSPDNRSDDGYYSNSTYSSSDDGYYSENQVLRRIRDLEIN